WNQRGEHRIDDELVFSNHTADVFHDSRETESGSTEELGISQRFIRHKCKLEKRDWQTYHIACNLNCMRYGLTLEYLRLRKLTTMFYGTCQWTTNDHSSTSIFRRPISRSEWCDVTDIHAYIQQLFPVPVIVVFTKYDQFWRHVQIHVEDVGSLSPDDSVIDVADKQFGEYYLRPLGDDVRSVQLESRFRGKIPQLQANVFWQR
ncbi:hypothetical protein EDB84DRAFT_1278713, partial [Lactarius hengduanensis]